MRSTLTFSILTIALLASMTACVGTSTTDLQDKGEACVLPADADDAHQVEVDFLECLSSSCDSLVDSSCSVSLDGDTLTIEASGTIESQGRTCTADCGQSLVTCETPPLPAGTYTLVYGDSTASLEVPSLETRTCAGTP